MEDPQTLSARERQIMDVVYSLGKATVNDVLSTLPEPPSRSAVRTFLRILEQKGHLQHKQRGREYVFRPTRPRKQAGKSAVQHVVKTFFDGSLEQALGVYLSNPNAKLTQEEIERLERLIRSAKKKEGK